MGYIYILTNEVGAYQYRPSDAHIRREHSLDGN